MKVNVYADKQNKDTGKILETIIAEERMFCGISCHEYKDGLYASLPDFIDFSADACIVLSCKIGK